MEATYPVIKSDEALPPLIAEGLYSFSIGGSERVGVDMALAFKRRGYRVACFAFYGSDGPFKQELLDGGIACPDLDYTTRNRFVRRLTYQYQFYRYLRANGVRALHVHHATALMLCGIPAWLAGVRNVVMTEHAVFQLQERPPYRRAAARYCRYASAITAVHQGIADYFQHEMGVSAERLHVVANGVQLREPDAATRVSLRAEIGLTQQDFVFLYVGRLEDVKDLGTLLHAYAALPDSLRTTARVVLAGDGSCRAELESLRDSLGLAGRVIFLGARNDIPNLLSMADAFVMTSRTEGLPMAMIEAMGAGLPVISTAVGGIPELLSGGAGLTAPAKDPDGISQAMATLLTDPVQRSQMAQRAREKIETHYSLDGVVSRYLGLLGLPAFWPPRN